MRKMFFVIGVIGVMLAMGSSAHADIISFNLATEEGGGATPSASLITVTVTTNVAAGTLCPLGTSSSVCVEVEFAPAVGSTLTKINQPSEINVNGTFDASTPDSGGFAGGFNICGPGTANTCVGGGEGASFFGTMNLETAGTDIADVFIYLTPGPGNNAWSDTAGAANVLLPTSKGFDALVANDPIPSHDPVQVGGEYTASPVPEPTSVLLLSTVALLVGGTVRKRVVRIVNGQS
jgi:hypothetical protein